MPYPFLLLRTDSMTRRTLVLGLLLSPALASGQDNALPVVSEATSPGRSLTRGLDIALGGRPETHGMSEVLYLLVDPTPSVRNAGLAPALAASLNRQIDRFTESSVFITVVRAGEASKPRLELSQDPAAIVATVESMLLEPDRAYHSLCADLRELCEHGASVEALKDVLVISFDNVDVEDDVEKTAARLKAGNWRCFFLTRETPLSDSYWARRSPYSGGKPPPNAILHGSDGPFVDFPFALLFQRSYPNEESPSGFAPWMTSRLAYATGGTVFLHSPGDATGHGCSNLGGCRFCDNDHRPERTVYLSQQLSRLAPPVSSRKEAGTKATRDPFFRLVATIWTSANKDGLMTLSPPFKIRGSTLRMQQCRPTRKLPFAGARSFGTTASVARETRQDCEALIRKLSAGIEMYKAADALPRYRANAEFLLLALKVTRFNLLHLQYFAEDVGETLTGKTVREYEPPEISPFKKDQFFKGVQWNDITLCHGAAVLHRLRLPGGDVISKEIDQLDSELTRFMQRWARSPHAVAAARLELPIFFTSMATYGGRPKVRPTSTARRVETKPPARPQRGGAGSAASGSGATTGGRR